MHAAPIPSAMSFVRIGTRWSRSSLYLGAQVPQAHYFVLLPVTSRMVFVAGMSGRSNISAKLTGPVKGVYPPAEVKVSKGSSLGILEGTSM
jgi:hypothetical protein